MTDLALNQKGNVKMPQSIGYGCHGHWPTCCRNPCRQSQAFPHMWAWSPSTTLSIEDRLMAIEQKLDRLTDENGALPYR